MAERSGARVTACSYSLFHAPYFSKALGTTPAGERAVDPDSEFLKKLEGSFRSFEDVVGYAPNQAFIGNTDPRELPGQPWFDVKTSGSSEGLFGDILDETALYGLIKYSDVFGLVLLSVDFSKKAREALELLPAMKTADLASFDKAVGVDAISAAVEDGAFPLYTDDDLVGCVKAAHPTDVNMSAHTMVENLTAKATAVYALRRLNTLHDADLKDIQYIIETSEEACGDMNQRGGGNFAKAIGELANLSEATGSDTRSFCAGPVHGIMQAASLVSAGTFEAVTVVAGGTTAKLAMNAKKHLEKGLPVLEDVMGAFAVLIEGKDRPGLTVRTDAVGYHKIGAGSAPQAVIGNLVADPLEKAGLRFSDIDVYAPELHNPEITGQAGAGNVTLQNLKMIAAMAVMKKELDRTDMQSFIEAHGVSGWAPTQGHIPSGVPALGWFLKWAEAGTFNRGLVIGKGSLFLGRMTNLFDGVSLICESSFTGREKEISGTDRSSVPAPRKEGEGLRIGCTVTGAETPGEELEAAAAEYTEKSGKTVIHVYSGTSDRENHASMNRDLETGVLDGALTFHYNFPLGTATVGLVSLPGNGKQMFIATTTGTTATERVQALVKNAIQGRAAARAWGIEDPSIGVLNLEGASLALKELKKLEAGGYDIRIAGSGRSGDALLRGNDILKGTCDVLVCDSLTGNAVVKLLGAYGTAGDVETTGAGYGCGLVGGKPVGIISRATSGSVAKAALEYLEKMIRGSFADILEEEYVKAEKAGLSRLVGEGEKRENNAVSLPPRVPVDTDIEGIDVLAIEDAVRSLLEAGIYCESGMGCTGPVVMVAKEYKDKAKVILKDRSFL